MLKQISEFPDYYVSDKGEVYSNKQGRYLKPTRTDNGYEVVYLSNGSTSKYCIVSRLVAEAFIPNPENKPCVDHKDNIRHHNWVENLQWVTYSENNRKRYTNSIEPVHKPIHSTERPLSNNSKAVACYTLEGKLVGSYPSASEAARHLGIRSISNIAKCCRGERKTCCDMLWRYIDE